MNENNAADIPLRPDISANPPPEPEAPVGSGGSEIKAWLDWAQQLTVAGGTLSKLALLELRLAVGDSGRLFAVGLLMLPLLFLAWIGLSVLLAWLAYLAVLSVTVALITFLLIQVVALIGLLMACKQYRKSLSLPATRRNLQNFMERARDGSPSAENRD